MATYAYPTNAELNKVAQSLLPVKTLDDPIFGILPIERKDYPVVMWEQMDDYIGLQQLRGLGGQPNRVAVTGGKRYTMDPGVYGEFISLGETELTMRRPYGEFNGSMDVTELVLEKQDQLMTRRINRIKYIGWTLISAGTFSVSLPTGGVAHTDTYTTQTYSGSAWGTAGSGTPLADFRAVQLKQRGYSLDFGAGAVAYMNRVTANKLLANTNAADLGGKKVAFGASATSSINDFNTILEGEGLPKIVVYDGGYKNDSGTFVPFIADNKTVVIGRRLDGLPIGHYQMTRNASAPGMQPGEYSFAYTTPEPPVTVNVHDGHNGGPTLEFPSAIVILTTT
jgi:hypothetical protein